MSKYVQLSFLKEFYYRVSQKNVFPINKKVFFFLDSDIFIGEILAKCPILSLSVYSRVGKLFIHQIMRDSSFNVLYYTSTLILNNILWKMKHNAYILTKITCVWRDEANISISSGSYPKISIYRCY